MKNPESASIEAGLRARANPEKSAFLPRFFKTGKGQYGEGDRFLGVVVPDIRLVARGHRDASLQTLDELLRSVWHECRLCALLILVEQFKKADEKGRKQRFDFYLAHTSRVNNWDLVDLSAPTLVGLYLTDKPRDVLYRLADSSLLWEQRIAVVATQTLIKAGDFADLLQLAEMLLHHPHDLMHKAIGWMLREVGKQDRATLTGFLNRHARQMPRTMLRYAIEHYPESERRQWMKRE